VGNRGRPTDSEMVILDAVKKRAASSLDGRAGTPLMGMGIETNSSITAGPRDRVEDLLSSIVGLDHIKSQVSCI